MVINCPCYRTYSYIFILKISSKVQKHLYFTKRWYKNNAHLFDVGRCKVTCRSKSSFSQSHVFFGLWVKCWIFNETVCKHPQMTFHLEWFDIKTTLASFLFNCCDQFITYLIHNVGYVWATLKEIKLSLKFAIFFKKMNLFFSKNYFENRQNKK